MQESEEKTMYKIPEEIKSGIYLGVGIYLFDLMAVAGFWFMMSAFDELIYPSLSIVYTLFNIMLAIVLTRPSHSNPGKKIYHTLLYKYEKRKAFSNRYHERLTM